MTDEHDTGARTRREMLGQSGGLIAALSMPGAAAAPAAGARTADAARSAGERTVKIAMRVNGCRRRVEVDTRTSLSTSCASTSA